MNILNKVSDYLDDHIQIVTKIGFIVAGFGILSIARRSRLLTKFHDIFDIPDHFVGGTIKLRAKVIDVQMNSVVMLQHIPAFSRLYFIAGGKSGTSNSKMCDGALRVSLAGVRLDEPGCASLKNGLCGKTIWFQLLSSDRPMLRNPGAILYSRKMGFLRNVNVTSVRLGHGVADPLPPCDHHKVCLGLQRKLLKAQKYAARKKKGMWKD